MIDLLVAGNLLTVDHFEGDKTPLMMEIPVNLETSPYLVTSMRGLLWLDPKRPHVRSVFRSVDLDTLFQEIVSEVAQTGAGSEWGNVHPLTRVGLVAAIAHLISYDIPSPEILVSPDFDWSVIDLIPNTLACEKNTAVDMVLGCRVVYATWLFADTIVVVPGNREFLGMVLSATEDLNMAIVHNASRGLAVCRK